MVTGNVIGMRFLRPAALAIVVPLLAACGDAPASTTTSVVSSVGGTDAPAVTTALPKPTVSLPAQLPTTLVSTDLTVGTGPAAVVGDTVVVRYVGVRSATGQEFDSNYDGQAFSVLLGAGKVIPGWEQGLVGVQQGGRRQLDIPADLAYGANPQGPVIQAGDALTFVIDVIAVLPTSKAADEPQITVAAAPNIDVLQSTELIVGTGPTPKNGQTVAIQLVAYRADTGEQLDSTWGTPPLVFAFAEETNVDSGLIAAVKGMHVGGRRQAQIPFILMFSGQGSSGLGLPPSIDLVVVIDLVALY